MHRNRLTMRAENGKVRVGEGTIGLSRTGVTREARVLPSHRIKSVLARRQNQHARRVRYPEAFNRENSADLQRTPAFA